VTQEALALLLMLLLALPLLQLLLLALLLLLPRLLRWARKSRATTRRSMRRSGGAPRLRLRWRRCLPRPPRLWTPLAP